jgi:hypothetical protein
MLHAAHYYKVHDIARCAASAGSPEALRVRRDGKQEEARDHVPRRPLPYARTHDARAQSCTHSHTHTHTRMHARTHARTHTHTLRTLARTHAGTPPTSCSRRTSRPSGSPRMSGAPALRTHARMQSLRACGSLESAGRGRRPAWPTAVRRAGTRCTPCSSTRGTARSPATTTRTSATRTAFGTRWTTTRCALLCPCHLRCCACATSAAVPVPPPLLCPCHLRCCARATSAAVPVPPPLLCRFYLSRMPLAA